jgi:hypothetical protein
MAHRPARSPTHDCQPLQQADPYSKKGFTHLGWPLHRLPAKERNATGDIELAKVPTLQELDELKDG